MKRSEAERLINSWLDNATVITGETILNFLEDKIDMLPPENPNNFHDVAGETVYIREWEPEDE